MDTLAYYANLMCALYIIALNISKWQSTKIDGTVALSLFSAIYFSRPSLIWIEQG